jgi:transcriptional regulator with XRE-family HTH domain
MEYYRQILVLRAARDLTQAQLAEEAGITEKVLGLVERGTVEPGPEMEARIAVALDWPPDELARVAFGILDGDIKNLSQLLHTVEGMAAA